MNLKSIGIIKLMFLASRYLAIVVCFIINLLTNKFRPYQGLAVIVELGLQRGLTLCLVGNLDSFSDV